jgi:hypothetical protein
MDIDFEAELAELMAEPAYGYNRGSRANGDGRWHSLDTESHLALEAAGLLDGGGVVLNPEKSPGAGGMVSHARNQHHVLDPIEETWVDLGEVRREAEGRLRCSALEFRQVYGRTRGRVPRKLVPLRDRLDTVLATDVSNLARLAEVMGVPERNLQRAAARGRK